MKKSFRLSRDRLSISVRLTLWYGLTLLLLLSLFATFSYVSFHTGLHRDFDRHLDHERRQLMPYLRIENGLPLFVPLEQLRSVAYQTDGVNGTYVRLIKADGEELYQSPNFAENTVLPVVLPGNRREASVSRTWDGDPARSLYMPIVDTVDDLVGWLEITGFEWTLHQDLFRLGRTLIIGILFSVLLAIGGGLVLAKRALNPVAALTAGANQIRATDLSARLPTHFGVRDELTELAETFNSMIGRLEASFERERRFTSNAAHELLTPLTTMRNGVEIVLRREREPQLYRDKLSAFLGDIDDTIVKIRSLLQLSRAERLEDLPRENVDLGAICTDHVERFRDRANAKDVRTELRSMTGLYIRADRVQLGEVIDNLIDNALKYTLAGGGINVEIAREGRDAVITVSDNGIGFDSEQADLLFDRFYRADTVEVQAVSGSGLGLSIVEAIVRFYGGTLSASSEGTGKGSTFFVRLPLTDATFDSSGGNRVGSTFPYS